MDPFPSLPIAAGFEVMLERCRQVGGGILAVGFESGDRAGQIRRLVGLGGFHCVKIVGQGLVNAFQIIHEDNLARDFRTANRFRDF
jgi:hypothetical protein